jgi:hypothetical protein
VGMEIGTVACKGEHQKKLGIQAGRRDVGRSEARDG